MFVFTRHVNHVRVYETRVEMDTCARVTRGFVFLSWPSLLVWFALVVSASAASAPVGPVSPVLPRSRRRDTSRASACAVSSRRAATRRDSDT